MGLGLVLGLVGYVVLDLAWTRAAGDVVVLVAVVGLVALVLARRR